MMGEVIRLSGRTPDVRDILKEAMLSQRFADVALCCPGGQRFLAHRLVLSAASPYLQEVLLAHSKVTAQCEPITVILAEMEAPELAALLGFIYTGNVTIPRMRLNAFLHAAETLRIRLPPVPAMTICDEQAADCKLEDVKEDVKIGSKYLQCDRYSWGRSERPPYEDALYRKDSCIRIFANDHNRDILRDAGTFHEVNNPGPSFDPGCASAWPVGSFLSQDGATGDLSTEKDHSSAMLADKNLAINYSNESSFHVYQRDACFPAGGPPAEEYGGSESFERIRTGYGRLQVSCSTEKPMDENAGGPEFCGRMRDECPYLGGIPSSSLQCPATGRTRSSERFDYASQVATGEDLSCSESCCRWRTSRKHVANRVTASPWRQIIRPHHSPRMPRPTVVLQRHVDDVSIRQEVQKKPVTPEPTRSTVISMSPKVHSPRSTPRSDGHYAFEVSTTCERAFNSDARSRTEIIGGPETKIQEIYRSPVSFAPSNQIAPLANTMKNNESFQTANNNTLTQLLATGNDSVITNTSGSNECSTHVTPHTLTKLELSHPISRLCDTIDSEEKKETAKTELAGAEKDGEERIARIFVNSDDNNNNETISTEVVRGRSADDHRCDQCGKTFVTRASLKTHSRTHSGEKPFRCADCGKQFSQLRNYKYHRSVHEGTREFAATCPECGKYFNDRGYLSSHMKIHRNRKEYGCAECGKSFNQRVAYNMHVRIHTGVKPHQCEQCGKAFSRKMLLKQHMRTHSGERPYQCQVCQKAFADRSNMTLHTRLHSGLKPYQCNLCSKAFTKKHHLKTHLNYHTGTKPYTCTNCGSRFSQSSNMRTHFKKCIVNNAAGVTKSGDEAGVESGIASQVALTPPNSDQESSILTPIPKSAAVTESNA